MPEPVVRVRDLHKTYAPSSRWIRLMVRTASRQPVTALAGVDLTVDAGKICAVIGPNGAGKSTLFRILTGLTSPTSGEVTILGMDPERDGHRVRRQIGFMPAEDRTLFLRHTCVENLRIHGRLQGLPERTLRDRIDETLSLVNLWEARDRIGFALSSGMRARLMLARAVLADPRILILDEPTGAIDPLGAQHFLELIMKITAERRTATLLSSHRLEEIEALRDNVLLLDQGRTVYWGDLDRVEHYASKRTYEIVCTDEAAATRVATRLEERQSDLAVVRAGAVVTINESASAEGLGWLGDLNGDVSSISLRTLSLRETISALLDQEAGQ